MGKYSTLRINNNNLSGALIFRYLHNYLKLFYNQIKNKKKLKLHSCETLFHVIQVLWHKKRRILNN